ncbi:MAG: sigma-70 family RNA polymerase sigma factor [Ruminiclostridium sp.]|nr:sigma-70 family RNA polymerase sigma factor [Ruminiclostridium sp.]
MLPIIYIALVDDEDVPAFEKMYNRTYKKLYSIAYDILKDHQLAEDALSEMYLRISLSFKKINNFPLHVLDAYLVRSIKNTCYNYIEKNDSERKKLDELVKNNVKDIDETVFDKIDLDLLMEAVISLPEPFKTALVMKEYYELTADEIAKQIKVSKRSVFYYIKAAKALIIKQIEGSDQNE